MRPENSFSLCRRFRAAAFALACGLAFTVSIGQVIAPIELRRFEEGVSGFHNHSNHSNALVNANGTLFFIGDDGWHNAPLESVERRPSLWKSDGTSSGTVLVKENVLRRGAAASEEEYDQQGLLSYVHDLIALGGKAIFTVKRNTLDEFGNPVEGRWELWSSDGMEAGTLLIQYPEHVGWSPEQFTVSDGILYFTAWDGLHGRELWRTDGTEMGTFLVSDIYPGEESSNPGSLTDADGVLLFSADDGVHGRELWKREPRGGGGAVVEMVKDISPSLEGWIGSSHPDDLVYLPGNDGPLDGAVAFKASNNGRRDFWVTRGTALSTVEAEAQDRPDGLMSMGSLVFKAWPQIELDTGKGIYYSFDDGTHGRELWRTDGNNWSMLADLTLGSGHSNPNLLTKVGDRVYFVVNVGNQGRTLWQTDGTPSGTEMTAHIAATNLTEMDGSLYFTSTYTLYMIPGATLTIEPALPQVAVGSAITLSAVANGTWTNTTITEWRWQAKAPGEPEFLDISDTSGFFGDNERSTLPIRYASLDLHGTQYRCIATLNYPDIVIESKPVSLGVGISSAKLPFTFAPSGELLWRLPAVPGQTYRLYTTSDLSQWSLVDTVLATGETVTLKDSTVDEQETQRFYRVE